MADGRIPPAVVLAAPGSGSGKTTVTLGLLGALRRQGVAVAPFKVGPDFIDPGYHGRAAGRISRNLDGWMCGRRAVLETYARASTGARLAVVEGVMGLFDGAGPQDDRGSTAEVARWLGGRILLVVDARGAGRSVVPLVKGFTEFDPALRFAGVICNRVGSPRHAELLRAAFDSVSGLPPLLGCLPRREDLQLPERHLGLVTVEDAGPDPAFWERLADWAEENLDLEPLLDLSDFREPAAAGDLPPAPGPKGSAVKIAVARDEAFCFCYPENLERLEAAGARMTCFSPLRDGALPEGVQGLYLPGGYPELAAGRLAANRPLLGALREAAASGMPIYAECGGLLLLVESLEGKPMAGVLPARAHLRPRRAALGYREVRFRKDLPLGPAGTVARGHEFHYSVLEPTLPTQPAFEVRDRRGDLVEETGFALGNVLASYVHLHFDSQPALAGHFVRSCRRWRQQDGEVA